MSQEVAGRFVDALHELEEKRHVETLVEIHTEDCEVGNVAVPETFDGHDGVSILEIEGGRVRRFMAYFDPRHLTNQVVDRGNHRGAIGRTRQDENTAIEGCLAIQ